MINTCGPSHGASDSWPRAARALTGGFDTNDLRAHLRFDHAEGTESRDLTGESGTAAGGDDVVEVLVRHGCLLGERSPRTGAHPDAVGVEFHAQSGAVSSTAPRSSQRAKPAAVL